MRFLALLAAFCAVIPTTDAVDPCKRQPFRGRCPSKNGDSPKRSQFVLRYYMRNGECVSYPYGHCANDDSEPQLYRYKEECEDACINSSPGDNVENESEENRQTYTTTGPTESQKQNVEKASTLSVTSTDGTTQKSTTTKLTTASTAPTPKTECERRRAHATKSTIRGGFVPVCTALGSFEKVQCEPDGRQCFCVDSKGIELANSRTRSGQRPDCDRIQSAYTPTTKECVGNAVRGPCSGSMDRWYYDEKEAVCKRFVFSGCGGNGNNYETKEACSQRCAPPPMGLPKCEKGEPLMTKLGVAVNCAESDCPSGYKCSVVQQSSVCCPENNKIIGLQTSATSDVCFMSKDRGPCDKYELRFYFNADLKECKYFFWGGCQGNGNNFEKVEDCESTCGISKVKANKQTTTQSTILENRPYFKTTQGIRITPGIRTKTVKPTTADGSTSVVTSFNTAATIPVRLQPSMFESTADLNSVASGATQMVHVAVTRAPAIPEMSLLEGIEEKSADGVNRCLHPKDPGNCRGQFVRWYWDNENKICDVFTYTGCQGNGNNYGSREECMAICHKEAITVVVQEQNSSGVCKHDVDAGECNGSFQRFAFDTDSGECRPFTYGGCGGNGNNFATLAECRIKCQKVALSPGNLCDHDIEVGECSGVFVRFGYDKTTNDCRQFTYGGCGGNGNNFATVQECRNVCVKKLCNPNPQCDLTRCQIVNDRNGCPFCSCPPTNQPSPPGLNTPQCPEIDLEKCEDPCMVINNRKGCKDCVCPSSMNTESRPPGVSDRNVPLPKSRPTLHSSSGEVTHLTPGVVRPPATPTNVGPPAGPSIKRVQPPSSNNVRPRQESVRTVQSTQAKQIEIDSKHFMPPPLSTQLQEKCTQPVEPGPCKHFVDRWYFNSIDGTCHPFKYGGCAGNRNHFFSRKECEIHCARFLRIASDVADDDGTEETIIEDDAVGKTSQLDADANMAHRREPVDVDSSQTRIPPIKSTVSGHIVHEDNVYKPVGREPVPLKPMGIGRHMMELDIDGLEEPTTVIPLVTSTTRQPEPSTTKIVTASSTSTVPTTSSPVSSTTTTISSSTTQQSPTTSRSTTASIPTTIKILPADSIPNSIDARIVCVLPPDPGACFDYVPRWFFNAQSGQCEQFSYGSCGGNENNFMDRNACESRCIPAHSPLSSHMAEQCAYASDRGTGGEYHVKWYFNVKNLRCEQFVYAGHGGNSNQFDTITECERTCSVQPPSAVKTLPKATSPPQPNVVPPHVLRPLPDEQPLHVSSQIVEDDESEDYGDEQFGTSTVASSSVPIISNSIDTRGIVEPARSASAPVHNHAPGSEPHPPAAQAAKTVLQSEREPKIPLPSTHSPERKKNVYKADPIPDKPAPTGNEQFPLVAPSPPMSVNYQTGEVKSRVNGIRTFQESSGKATVEDSDLTEDEEERRRDLLSCPNGLQEMRYPDGRPVMCLPGKNQCPEKSVCYFNGLDFFCCPNEEDPYDKHVFGGYDGEETKHGYKVFGPLNAQRLSDEVPLRARRMAYRNRRRREATNSALNPAPQSFNLDSIVAPLRFDDEKPRQFSRAQRMRPKPSPPNHGNPICVEPLSQGDCGSAHLRYYYDRDTDTCRLFYYSGCKGNNNNFGSLIDCQKLCVLGGQRPRPQYELTTSTSSIPPGYCPDGTAPLGGTTPVLCGNSTDSIACPIGYYCLTGPPDVCCPHNKIEETADETKSIRFAPKVADAPPAPSRKAHLSTPKYMCPDASDPIMSSNGVEPVPCGSGFDGLKLCPRGFYCAIDVEKQSRMCCPLYGAAERVPNDQSRLLSPYLGRHPSKLEDTDASSLPHHGHSKDTVEGLEATTAVLNEDSAEIDNADENESEEDGGMAHLMIKPVDVPQMNEVTNVSIIESNEEGTIEMATETPSVDETVAVKAINDKSVCQIKPSEGRTCREDEQSPRTNLHYFYSPKDRRCKLYFYRGCGGNANRFEKKSDCERLCLS